MGSYSTNEVPRLQLVSQIVPIDALHEGEEEDVRRLATRMVFESIREALEFFKAYGKKRGSGV